VMLDVATTGDGILTAIRLASLIGSSGEPASKIAGRMRKYPQGQKALKVARKEDLEKAGTVWEEVRKIEKELAGKGRVFVRASGTEPVVRIMVEAAEQYMVDGMLERLTAAVEEALS
ncbi:MAG TPA: phosphoglucosamine mutase, partial [Bacillota bacterium]|nr:phosphoglucosamine mutase [Bacillota bacterium]